MKILKNLVIAVVAIFTSVTGLVVAAESQFVEGKDYKIVSYKGSEKPVVEEFFNYACGACFTTEQFVIRLKKNNPDLIVKPIPVELRKSWKIYVDAYYIGEKLGILDKSHSKVFDHIHVKKKHFKNKADMKAFFLELGVDEKAYDDVASSYWLNNEARKAKQYAFKRQITTTPSFLVNKMYKIDSKSLGNYDQIEKAIVELSGVNKKVVAAK